MHIQRLPGIRIVVSQEVFVGILIRLHIRKRRGKMMLKRVLIPKNVVQTDVQHFMQPDHAPHQSFVGRIRLLGIL
jgi:hypothetical protein